MIQSGSGGPKERDVSDHSMNAQSKNSTGDSDSTKATVSLRKIFTLFIFVSVVFLGVVWLLLDDVLTARFLQMERVFRERPAVYASILVLILGSDLLLPVPSSLLITHASVRLGVLGGTMVGFFGITIGSLLGFVCARWWGQRFVERKVSEADRRNLTDLMNRYGLLVVVLLRPVPILAEASVLLLGLGQMKFLRFLFWLCLSNFFVSLFFALLGDWATKSGIGELTVMFISITIPVILLLISQFYFQRMTAHPKA